MKRALTAAGVLAIALIAAAFYQTAVNTIVSAPQTYTGAQTFAGTLTVPNGTACTAGNQGIIFTTPAEGFFYDSANGVLDFCLGGNRVAGVSAGGAQLVSTGVLGFSSGAVGGAYDTAFSRSASGVMALGTGAAGNTNAVLKDAGNISVGTTFTSNAGCTESALAGGATAGKFTVGQGTACTIVITMGNSATAPNGWNCAASDQTGVPAVAIRQTASNATSCSLLMTVTTSDVISFSAEGY